MSKLLPEVSKQIRSEDIREVLEKNFVSIIPVWAPLQLAWVNNVYRTFHDYDKFMIIMHNDHKFIIVMKSSINIIHPSQL